MATFKWVVLIHLLWQGIFWIYAIALVAQSMIAKDNDGPTSEYRQGTMVVLICEDTPHVVSSIVLFSDFDIPFPLLVHIIAFPIEDIF